MQANKKWLGTAVRYVPVKEGYVATQLNKLGKSP